MEDVKEDIKHLIRLVKKDMAIKENMAVLGRNPARIEVIDRKLAEMDQQVKEKEQKLEELEKEKRHLKGVIDSELDKIRQKKIEESKIATNTAYRAWEHELAYLQKNLDQHEEKMLFDLEKIDKINEELDKFRNEIEDEKRGLIEKKSELEEEIRQSRERLSIIEDEKLRVLPHISERVRKQYSRVLDAKGDSGVANLKNEICQGCFSKVPPQICHEVKKNDKIIRCENCGRILVYYEAAEDGEE
ncbi:MAG: hypothetical protein GF417_07480 [Candidatus Latescibacteria bacterium]|nr:hypothetical protein [bacterium]MBD3424260.1 hypothetical protein [Candidatus Latescibacterota bacterium]